MANKVTPVDYDFATIKSSLQSYLQNQTEFADYKFDGSAMSTFLDVLAYNTHYNAMTVNFGLILLRSEARLYHQPRHLVIHQSLSHLQWLL